MLIQGEYRIVPFARVAALHTRHIKRFNYEFQRFEAVSRGVPGGFTAERASPEAESPKPEYHLLPRLVLQEGAHDCGVACLAMAAGVEYQEAKQQFDALVRDSGEDAPFYRLEANSRTERHQSPKWTQKALALGVRESNGCSRLACRRPIRGGRIHGENAVWCFRRHP